MGLYILKNVSYRFAFERGGRRWNGAEGVLGRISYWNLMFWLVNHFMVAID